MPPDVESNHFYLNVHSHCGLLICFLTKQGIETQQIVCVLRFIHIVYLMMKV